MMNRRNVIKSFAGIPFLGGLAGKVNGDVDSENFSLRFSDGCIDHDNLSKTYFSCTESIYENDNTIKEKTIEFRESIPIVNNLSNEEVCSKHSHNNSYNFDNVFLYKGNSRYNNHIWKLSSVRMDSYKDESNEMKVTYIYKSYYKIR